MKIHITEATKKLLDQFKTFKVTSRGEIELKVCSESCENSFSNSSFVFLQGKGKMTTYWLDSYIENPPQ